MQAKTIDRDKISYYKKAIEFSTVRTKNNFHSNLIS